MILINDTNIWIDLKHVNLVEEVFKLPFEIGATDILFNEELMDRDGELLLKNNIKIIEMTTEELLETGELLNSTTGVGFNDLTTLVVSDKRDYTLVTGDGNLRKIAQRKNVRLKGSIWILDQLVENNIISKPRGVKACEDFLSGGGRRLPINELKKRIEIWKD